MKYVCHFRESPDSPQWEEDFATKAAADKKALEIFLDGGIAIVIEVPTPDTSNIVLASPAKLNEPKDI